MPRNLIPLAVATALLAGGAYAQNEEPCPDGDCFVAAVEACEAASYQTRDGIGLGAEATYRVLGPEGNACRIEFAFTENPNPAFVDKPLSFVVDPDAASKDMLLKALESCLTGSAEGYACSGPLVEEVAGGAHSSGTLVAGQGPFPCGVVSAEAEGAPLYPMPKDGKWGYVDRDGEWRIAPQWDRVQDFHEGRAAVGGQHAWGIIDRDGEYVVEQRHEGTSSVTINGERWVSSPFEPYSEGCTVADLFTDSPQRPFFVDRDGNSYWREELPEALRMRDIRAFGTFSEGLAWFQENLWPDARYGWIDSTGSIVIEPEFVKAGRFSGGLAPASSREGQAGFISPDGRLQLPRKWTLEGAAPFSEGLAQVWTGPFETAFMNQSDFVFDRVTFGDRGNRPAEAEIGSAGAFHDGLAPVVTGAADGRELVYVRPDGQVAFVPDEIDGIAVCDPRQLSNFHDGLVRLVVAKDGQSCGNEAYLSGLADFENARYVYLDTGGRIVLRQEQ